MKALIFSVCMAATPFLVYVIFRGYRKREQSRLGDMGLLQLSNTNNATLAFDQTREQAEGTVRMPSVLIVDDQSSIQMLLREAFNSMNAQIVSAYSGQEAVEYIREQSFAVVLMDVKLPDMSGMDLLLKFRAMRPQLQVIMMSAFSDVNRIESAKSAGAIGYFSKPFDIDELRSFVASRL
ncbi:response regulator [Paenibacillus sp. ACRRX]|uniref:response regulator n=1 Tax=Paenibacillus sp. ACRRX TaxID=2918206 RepID=UPI001EF5B525|nr:response regulator [Paenibacillus sp. ACRRX]MCG7409324.1 response regulator [Paenibacillus sp. ACRRX]